MLVFDPNDRHDGEILSARQARRTQISARHHAPLVGDVLVMLDGTTRRVAHVHDYTKDVSIQPSSATIGSPSLYWHDNGTMDYSGALDSSIPITKFQRGRSTLASAWFFSHAVVCALNGVTVPAFVTEWTEQQ